MREAGDSPGSAPNGVVTLLFTDVEGSTQLWARHGEAMAASLELHDDIVTELVEQAGGHVFSTAGDSFAVAFSDVAGAVATARSMLTALERADWPGPALRVRMGLHLGRCHQRNDDYFGPTVNLAARISSAGHGGQLLASDAVATALGAPTRDLGEHVLAGIDEPVRINQLVDGDFPPLRTATDIASTLPAHRDELIGRDEELARVRRLLASSRLVTLTGVGGAGKTRLAVEAARSRTASFPGGVFFVDLTRVGTDDDIESVIAEGCNGSRELADPIGELRARPSMPTLVVLDNCEHVIESAADWVDRLLGAVDHVSVLATSREALEIEGERTFRVPSLGGGTRGPASILFLERASSASDSFVVADGDVELVASICDQLDGMPLAIELAAARVRVLPLAELSARLDDRFALLSGGRSRRRQRQQTLDAVIGWSYDLLDEHEQLMLRRLSVFVGGFDMRDVAEVTGFSEAEALELVDALVAQSLVEPTDRRGALGFRLLESVRIYALDRLVQSGEVRQARDAHLDHFAAAVPSQRDATKRDDWDRLARESSNISSAIGWAIDSRHDRIAELAQRFVGSLEHVTPAADLARLVLDDGSDLVGDHVNRQALLAATQFITHYAGMLGARRLPDELVEPMREAAAREVDGILSGRIPCSPSGEMLVAHRLTSQLPDTVDQLRRRHPAEDDNPGLEYLMVRGRVAAEAFAAGPGAASVLVDQWRLERPDLAATPHAGWTTGFAVVAAYIYSLAGRAEDAATIVAQVDASPPEDVPAGAQLPIARSLVLLGHGNHQGAADILRASVETRPTPLVSGQDSTFLAMYARLALATGDQERARRLIDLTLPREGLDFLLICDTKAHIENWPPDEFRKRSSAFRRSLLEFPDAVERVNAMTAQHAEERRRWARTAHDPHH